MADEFIKGFGIMSTAGLAWITLAAWYQTPSFYDVQLIAPPPEPETLFDAMGIFLIDVFLWTTILGMLAFWVLIPLGREIATSVEERRNAN
ncbi:DUF7314 family protein [Natronocalculus amylovorans]|uniref:DUF7314 domain-containing protein n=1 Tax=Natronocalculus amylovorans TaxID=2917812 RepID=A0AAE3FTP4_9EURY|nr:hypothetical protein [Natronocalculus amylovorans]MCL9815402.1 hypothetical protein [Natronocalculus amylovorans]NUE02083.1 hypothetical protein [Halorubraceae archaeon YAN]